MEWRNQKMHRLQAKLDAGVKTMCQHPASPSLKSATRPVGTMGQCWPQPTPWLHHPAAQGPKEGEKPSISSNPFKRFPLACLGHMLTPGPITGSWDNGTL